MSGGRTSLGEAGHWSCAFKEYVCALPPPTASYHMISAMMLRLASGHRNGAIQLKTK